MRAVLRLAATVFLCCIPFAAPANSTAAAPLAKGGKPAATAPRGPRQARDWLAGARSECLGSAGLCISVPAGWQRLANVFDDLGFVVAEPHNGAPTESWPQLTVAAIDVSPHVSSNVSPRDGNAASAPAPPPLDALVERMLTGEGALASAHLLERSRLFVNGANTQIVRVGLPESAGSAEAIETVALIEGDEGMVYSIALRCAPPDYNRLEPVFRQALLSWRLQDDDATPATGPSNSPATHRPGKPTEGPLGAPARIQPNAAQPGQGSAPPR